MIHEFADCLFPAADIITFSQNTKCNAHLSECQIPAMRPKGNEPLTSETDIAKHIHFGP